jgi:hypothetical protein
MALPGQISVPSKAGALLINAATATTPVPTTAASPPAALVEAKGFKGYTFQVTGIGTATVTFYGTLDPAVIAPWGGSQSVHWSPLGSVTADGFFTFSGPLVAVAAAVTAYTSGTISVWCFAVP